MSIKFWRGWQQECFVKKLRSPIYRIDLLNFIQEMEEDQTNWRRVWMQKTQLIQSSNQRSEDYKTVTNCNLLKERQLNKYNTNNYLAYIKGSWRIEIEERTLSRTLWFQFWKTQKHGSPSIILSRSHLSFEKVSETERILKIKIRSKVLQYSY